MAIRSRLLAARALPDGAFSVPTPRATDAAAETLRHAFGDRYGTPLPADWLALLARLDGAGRA